VYAEKLLPEPKILPPNQVSVYIPTSFTEYSFYRGGPPRKILAAPTTGNHGDRLRTNKQLLKAVFENLRISPDRRIFILAIAIQETQTMSPGERDWTKDCTTNDSANYRMTPTDIDPKQLLKGHPDAIKTVMKRLEEDAGLQSDNRHVGIDVEHH
jgi:hypothetical protein